MSRRADYKLGSATERTIGLLKPEVRKFASERDGYFDLLPDEPELEGVAQNLMRSNLVSRIYEHWWRPALGRVAKGALGPSMADEHRIARLLLGLRPGDGVLDVACGPGNFSRDFAHAIGDGGLVVGVDASRTMLDRAARETRAAEVDNLAFVFGDATRLPFCDASFDAACCFAALHMFDRPFDALDEMRRVITPGGHIAIFTSCRSRAAAFRAYERLLGSGSGMRMFEPDEITTALRERDFGEIQQKLAGFTQFVGGRLA